MTRPWGLAEEELIRDAAELPRLSIKLRSRVMRAARQEHRQRAMRRSLQWAAAVLIGVLGVGGWAVLQSAGTGAADQPLARHAESSPDRPGQSEDGYEESHSGPAGRIVRSGIGQWDHVEAVKQRRREHLKKLRRVF